MSGHRRLVAALVVCASLLAAGEPAAGKPARRIDLFWVHPDSSRFALPSIAVLPAATYDNNLDAAKLTDVAWGQAVRGAGYRWISGITAKDQIKHAPDGDSLLKALNAALLKVPRVDSLSAPELCARLRVAALLSLRVDNWSKIEMEWNQAGKPSTTVQIKAALVDSAGRLLWTAAGSETGEGPYQDPSTNTLGVRSSGLGTQPITGQGGAPAYPEVLAKLFARWAEHFPAKVKPPAAP